MIITTVTAIVQATSVPRLIINADCTKQCYIPVSTIMCWHLGDTKQRVMPVNVKEWCDNPSEFIPNVHNHLGVTVFHTVRLTRKLHTFAATWKHCVVMQDGVQAHAHFLVVHLCCAHTWEFEHAHRFQLHPFLLPEITWLDCTFITHSLQNHKIHKTMPLASKLQLISLVSILTLLTRIHEHHPTGMYICP